MITRTYKKIMTGLVALVAPSLAFAATVDGLLNMILYLTKRLTEIVFAFALLVFFWGIAVFVLNSGSSDGQTKGKNLMLWGIITFFVMASVWGIVTYLQNSVGLRGIDSAPDRPSIQIR